MEFGHKWKRRAPSGAGARWQRPPAVAGTPDAFRMRGWSAGRPWAKIWHTGQFAPAAFGLSGGIAFRPIVTSLRSEENHNHVRNRLDFRAVLESYVLHPSLKS